MPAVDKASGSTAFRCSMMNGIPIGSMYGIFTYMWLEGKYNIYTRTLWDIEDPSSAATKKCGKNRPRL